MEKPEYIKNIESAQGILSVTRLPSFKKFDKFLNEKFFVVYSSSSFDMKGISFLEKIFKTKQGFYIYIKYEEDDNWSVCIYYEQSKENELIFLTKQLIKENK
jgi:hypothetical protein